MLEDEELATMKASFVTEFQLGKVLTGIGGFIHFQFNRPAEFEIGPQRHRTKAIRIFSIWINLKSTVVSVWTFIYIGTRFDCQPKNLVEWNVSGSLSI